LDVNNASDVRQLIGDIKPKTVIHCAAYTLVDRAESEIDLCMQTNGSSVAHFASACREHNAVLVYISSDYVFGGAGHKDSWKESDPPCPLSIYGRSKLAGEEHAATWRKHFIVRSCGLYGHDPRRANFLEKILEQTATRDRLRVVHDQRCSPTYVEHLADAILFLPSTSAFGLYHVVNGGAVTWYEFASEILRQMDLDIPIDPIGSEELQAAAKRPINSVLDTSKYHALGGPVLPNWREALSEYLCRRRKES
jgi:dTDP-4-dehydrorhamnose reductase